ncbi:hypothetical protein D5018_13595 [Parashewanella curva]|uniref:Tyr recombinase domain-containing protein n=1 Tax=Parashewanella curva TaxID=2338552 RepID=A0A3L8PWJ4_9GAMM|nr:tyrosine-type recombinase/integrase [Parashewanella curva]RLV59169.1 hypothetical protein D5018_13595 [Parashewanella curva]
MKHLESWLVRFLDKPCRYLCLKDWHKKRLIDLTEAMVYKKHQELTKQSPAQADLVMRTLRALFNFAKSEYKSCDGSTLFPYNPVGILSDKRCWNNVARKQTRLRPSQLKPFLESVESVRNHAIEYREDFSVAVCDFVEFMLFTGLRKTELLELKWQDVYLGDELYIISRTKNGVALELPITEPLQPIFKRRLKYKMSDYVFGAENRLGRVIEPKKIVKKINEQAEVSFTLHDLRRTFCSIAENLRLGTYTLKRLMNHTTCRNDVTAGYTVLTAEELKSPAEIVCNKLKEYAGLIDKADDIAILKSQISRLSKEQKMELMAAIISG